MSNFMDMNPIRDQKLIIKKYNETTDFSKFVKERLSGFMGGVMSDASEQIHSC